MGTNGTTTIECSLNFVREDGKRLRISTKLSRSLTVNDLKLGNKFRTFAPIRGRPTRVSSQNVVVF